MASTSYLRFFLLHVNNVRISFNPWLICCTSLYLWLGKKAFKIGIQWEWKAEHQPLSMLVQFGNLEEVCCLVESQSPAIVLPFSMCNEHLLGPREDPDQSVWLPWFAWQRRSQKLNMIETSSPDGKLICKHLADHTSPKQYRLWNKMKMKFENCPTQVRECTEHAQRMRLSTTPGEHGAHLSAQHCRGEGKKTGTSRSSLNK